MCHLLTAFPLQSIISFQCLSSSSPVLSRPMENQPMISFLLIFLILTIENIRLTLGSSNSMIWKTNVSLNSGSYILRRMEVLLLESCWPIELNIATFTYVSDKRWKEQWMAGSSRDTYLVILNGRAIWRYQAFSNLTLSPFPIHFNTYLNLCLDWRLYLVLTTKTYETWQFVLWATLDRISVPTFYCKTDKNILGSTIVNFFEKF